MAPPVFAKSNHLYLQSTPCRAQNSRIERSSTQIDGGESPHLVTMNQPRRKRRRRRKRPFSYKSQPNVEQQACFASSTTQYDHCQLSGSDPMIAQCNYNIPVSSGNSRRQLSGSNPMVPQCNFNIPFSSGNSRRQLCGLDSLTAHSAVFSLSIPSSLSGTDTLQPGSIMTQDHSVNPQDVPSISRDRSVISPDHSITTQDRQQQIEENSLDWADHSFSSPVTLGRNFGQLPASETHSSQHVKSLSSVTAEALPASEEKQKDMLLGHDPFLCCTYSNPSRYCSSFFHCLIELVDAQNSNSSPFSHQIHGRSTHSPGHFALSAPRSAHSTIDRTIFDQLSSIHSRPRWKRGKSRMLVDKCTPPVTTTPETCSNCHNHKYSNNLLAACQY
jgi:hypothetical protein